MRTIHNNLSYSRLQNYTIVYMDMVALTIFGTKNEESLNVHFSQLNEKLSNNWMNKLH